MDTAVYNLEHGVVGEAELLRIECTRAVLVTAYALQAAGQIIDAPAWLLRTSFAQFAEPSKLTSLMQPISGYLFAGYRLSSAELDLRVAVSDLARYEAIGPTAAERIATALKRSLVSADDHCRQAERDWKHGSFNDRELMERIRGAYLRSTMEDLALLSRAA